MQQLADANKSPFTGGGARGIAEQMKRTAMAQFEEQRRANAEVGKFAGFLGGANKALAFAGLAGIGVGSLGAMWGGIHRSVAVGTSLSNPLLDFQQEQTQRDIKGSVGRNFSSLSQGELQRSENRRAALANPDSLAARQGRQLSNFMNFLSNLNPIAWLDKWEADRAKAKGITGVGAGANPMLGHTMSIDEYFSGLTMAAMQTPNDPQTANIRAIEANTKMLEQFAEEIKQSIIRIKALTPEIP